MAAYTIVVGGRSGLVGQLESILASIQKVDTYLDQLADEEILPILAKHYDQAGIKQGGKRTGDLKQAITKRGAAGNTISKQGNHLIVGVDYAQMTYAKWVLEGRGPVRAKKGKALHWIDPDTGKEVFAKRVGPAPAHPVYFLTPEELQDVEKALLAKILSGREGSS